MYMQMGLYYELLIKFRHDDFSNMKPDSKKC